MSFAGLTELIHCAFICSASWRNHILFLYNHASWIHCFTASSFGFGNICHWRILTHPRTFLNSSFLNSSFHLLLKRNKTSFPWSLVEFRQNSWKPKFPSSIFLLKGINRFWRREEKKERGRERKEKAEGEGKGKKKGRDVYFLQLSEW